MDINKVIETFQNSIDSNNEVRQAAENTLNQMYKIIDFTPLLLKIIIKEDVKNCVAHAAAIYFKNMLSQYWEVRDGDRSDCTCFTIHEKDKEIIRNNIVDVITRVDERFGAQLCVAAQQIIKADFPVKWPDLPNELLKRIQSLDQREFYGGLRVLYQVVKFYEYKKLELCGPRDEMMRVILPLLYERSIQLVQCDAAHEVMIQKIIFKIFYAIVQYYFPLNLISCEVFAQWMLIFQSTLERPVPQEVSNLDEDERDETIWWKTRKWAAHIIQRVFDRYGSPGNTVSSDYATFANWFLKTFSAGTMTVFLKILDAAARKQYVSKRVLQQSFLYLTQCVNHAICWKRMKSHLNTIVKDVIFPMMCFSDDDEIFWSDDPIEFVRSKLDLFEEFYSPVTAGEALLAFACNKRKEVLAHTLTFVVSQLNDPSTSIYVREGCLHLVGSLADVLYKKKQYRSQLEPMLITYVYSQFTSEHRCMRSRACWVVSKFENVRLSDNSVIACTQGICQLLLTDPEVPVKVNAALALNAIITNQPASLDHIRLVVDRIMEATLILIRDTISDDLNGVLQTLITFFEDEIKNYAAKIVQHLTTTFKSLIESSSSENVEGRAMTAMGILSTIQAVVTSLEENKEIIAQVEPIVLTVIADIIQNSSMEYYEEVLLIIYSLTNVGISPAMWQVYDAIHQLYMSEGYEYFLEFVPCLHNYIVVDREAFMSDPMRVTKMIEICESVLCNNEQNEDLESSAAKLLEVMVIECGPNLQPVMPKIMKVVLERLTKEISSSELRTMCLQVIVSAFIKMPSFMLEFLSQTKLPSGGSVAEHFFNQWFKDIKCFIGLHDRRVCVIGLCTLLEQAIMRRELIQGCSEQILPSLLLLFSGLHRAYEVKASTMHGNSSDDEDSGSSDESIEADDESDTQHDDEEDYLKALNEPNGDIVNAFDTNDDDDDDDDAEETNLEMFGTSMDDEDSDIDEYAIFKHIITLIQQNDHEMFTTLTRNLTDEQKMQIDEILLTADKRKAAAEARKIEKAGGYQFQQHSVPGSFEFSPEAARFKFGGNN